MKEHIRRCLREMTGKGMRRVVLYGTGDVADVTLPLARAQGLEVVGVVDDDPEKQGTRRGRHEVRTPEDIPGLDPDAVLITTFRHARQIRKRMDESLASSVRVLEL